MRTMTQSSRWFFAAAMIAFATSMDEFIMTFLITGSQNTLPLYIYGSMRFGATPALAVISSLVLVSSFILILLGAAIVISRQRTSRRRAVAA